MMPTKEDTEVAQLNQRIKQLETIEHEYIQLKELLDYAAKGKHLEKHANSAVLYVHPDSRQILDANSHALKFLGYTQKELFTITIDELEVAESRKGKITYVESSVEIQVYDCCFRHYEGHELGIKVRKWLITKGNIELLCYTLGDKSLRTRLWHELSRREDADYQFQEKLKNLNEVSIELGHLKSFHAICKRGVELGIQKLGFDRLALFFLDPSKKLMIGTFGVDEQGNLRDERNQSWEFEDSFIMDFVNGKREPDIKHDNAPLYNLFSTVVGYGWHVSAPILDGGEFIGFISADNLINKNKLQNFQPDLLRLFGATIGHLASRQLEQETIRKLSSAVQHSSSMIIVLNTQQVIEFTNNSFCQLSGYTLQEIIGKDLSILFPTRPFQTIKQTISSGKAWHGEIVNYKKNGEAYEAFVSISPVHLGNIIENFVIVQEDITLLKHARQKELTLQLEQERAQMLETFVTDIGHEFKTPLSIIHTSNYIMAQSQDGYNRQKHLSRIQEQVNVLSQMINDILEIVRLTSTLELQCETIGLGSFVQNVINEFMPSANEKQLTWHNKLASNIILEADTEKLARIIQEILENAIQFTPIHGTICVSLNEYVEQVGIIVQDSGIGIPADEIDKIFHRFYRVDKARTTRNTGLGLSVAKLLIEAHHGKIKIDSVLGQGSRFEILLPREHSVKEI